MPDGGFRVDATAWATIALHAAGCKEQILNNSRSRLVENQASDGRLNLLSDDPDVVWPTPPCDFSMARRGRVRGDACHGHRFPYKDDGDTLD